MEVLDFAKNIKLTNVPDHGGKEVFSRVLGGCVENEVDSESALTYGKERLISCIVLYTLFSYGIRVL